jgi:predicted NBD/HSP70 family sugar kinase
MDRRDFLKNIGTIGGGFVLGAGIIIDGKPVLGHLGLAGEFGHITADRNSGVLCECGNYGCLGALSSGNAIAKAVRTRLGEGQFSAIRDACGGNLENVTAEMVADFAKRGDPLAFKVFDKAVEYLGIGIANLINLVSPEAVVIGGGVAQAGPPLFNKVRKTVIGRALGRISSGVMIEPASFGIKAAVMGAVSLILGDVMNLNHDDGFPIQPG